jgi:radical SAM superfamily enzyme YgiQ (UPF0313 family)
MVRLIPALPGFASGRPRLPRAMRVAPPLDPHRRPAPPRPRSALLISPFYPKDPHGSFGKHVLTPSLALTSVAAATPPGWDVRFWDENLLQGHPPWDPFPEVVGITVHLTFAARAYELARWYRDRGAAVVLGGPHVQSCPGEAEPHADAIVLGDGAVCWPQLLADLDSGHLARRYEGDHGRPYREAPWPNRSVLPRRDFLTTCSLIATRGCRNRCAFCYLATDGLRTPFEVRDPDDVVREFVETGEPYGVFVDNNLGADPDYLRALCRSLDGAERIWSAAVTLDVTDDERLVDEMARAGCTGVFVGFETLNPANLDEARKRGPRPADYSRRVDVFHRCGIQVNGSFVFGFDHDGPDVFERTVEWIESTRLACATFHILTPYPGTPLFRQLEREDRLLHRDWSLYDTAHAVFRPRSMSPEALEMGYAEAYRRLFSARSIWRRRPAAASALLPYLAGMALYKRANWFWPLLIRHRMTHAAWRPLVELSRWHHVRQRACADRGPALAGLPAPPGV